MTGEKRFVVVQAAASGAWRHYLHAWVKNGVRVQDATGDPRALPVWLAARDQALKLDAQTAQQLVDHFDTRYRQTEGRRVVQHLAEELP
jgi:hypothetical protein